MPHSASQSLTYSLTARTRTRPYPISSAPTELVSFAVGIDQLVHGKKQHAGASRGIDLGGCLVIHLCMGGRTCPQEWLGLAWRSVRLSVYLVCVVRKPPGGKGGHVRSKNKRHTHQVVGGHNGAPQYWLQDKGQDKGVETGQQMTQ